MKRLTKNDFFKILNTIDFSFKKVISSDLFFYSNSTGYKIFLHDYKAQPSTGELLYEGRTSSRNKIYERENKYIFWIKEYCIKKGIKNEPQIIDGFHFLFKIESNGSLVRDINKVQLKLYREDFIEHEKGYKVSLNKVLTNSFNTQFEYFSFEKSKGLYALREHIRYIFKKRMEEAEATLTNYKSNFSFFE